MADPGDGGTLAALAERRRRGLALELLGWLARSRKWWLLPLLLLLLLAGLFVWVSGSGLAPFIYALF
ncbi:MAG TPA: DUF5989 family protein [Anaeromyxobacter sp.]